MVQGEKEAKGAGKLEKRSGLTTLPPPGCLRVLGKAVLTKRVSERDGVGRETQGTAPVGVGQERAANGWTVCKNSFSIRSCLS